jgi:FkbM family methyltransferase
MLGRTITVKHNKDSVFTIRNFGFLTKYRASTFSSKEPETIEWIDGFGSSDSLLDVGANIGLYSLYAASKGISVRSMEPDALNFALLNLHILDNGLEKNIIAYPYAINDKSLISQLNIQSYKWGGANSSFDRAIDWRGKYNFNSQFKQGSPGITIDEFVEASGFKPNHIKVDIDGNELLTLNGARKALNSKDLKSILIELYEDNPEYEVCLEILEKSGLVLKNKSDLAESNSSKEPKNHIFSKDPGLA